MKKLFILFIFMFFLTGCSASYDIEIYNNTVKEDLVYFEEDSSKWDSEAQYGLSYRELVNSSVNYPYPAFNSTVVDENDTIKVDGVEYYNNKLLSDNYKLGQSLSYHKFSLDNFNDSSIVKKCYQYFNIIEEDEKIILSTSLTNRCFDEYEKLDKITVNLKTNHKVISSNADSVKGYHYAWNLTRENKDDAGIQITLKKDEYIFNYENEFVKKVLLIGGITGIIIASGSITYLYFKKKRIKTNEI